MTDFITDFMTWVGQFVVVSTILMVATHLFAKKRRAQKRHAESLKTAQVDSKPEPEPLEAASVS
jgi:hypothetical protein